MRKKISSILIAMTLLVSFGFGACGSDKEKAFKPAWNDQEKQEQFLNDTLTGRASTIPEEKPTAIANKNVINNGVSAYKIVTPQNLTTAEGFAASEVQHFLQEATGCKLDIVSENAVGNSPYISVGDTELFKNSSVATKKDTLGFAGCMISTVGDNVFLNGADSTGVLNSGYQFLHYSVDYEAYSPDEIYLSKEKTVPLYAFDYTHSPTAVMGTSSMQMRTMTNAARMKMWDGRWGANNIDGAVWAGGYFAHSFLHLLDPSVEPGKSHTGDINTEDGWYSNGQLCLTKESAQDAMAKAVAKVFESSSSTMIMLGGMDNGQSCACNTCKSEALQYGGVGGIYARFLNNVADKVEAILDEEEFYIYGMSYNAYAAPPVTKQANGEFVPAHESVVLNEHAGMMVTTMGSCYNHSMGSDDMCNFASQFTDRFAGWATLTDNLFGYTYSINFFNYMIPFNDFNTIEDNIEFIGNLGYKMIYDQTSGNNKMNGFMELRTYIRSKATWDASVKVHADKYVDDFFVNYYKAAAVPMKKFYNKLRRHYATIQEIRGEYDVGIYDNTRYAVKSSWPLQVVEEFEGYIKEAYEAIDNAMISEETKVVIRQRVMAEELMCRWIRLTWYSTGYSKAEHEKLYAQFVEDCKYCGTMALQEGQTIN